MSTTEPATYDELHARIRELEAELTVVRFERDQLEQQRDAVRVYFGGTKIGIAIEQHADPVNSPETFEMAADRIYAAWPDKKIQAIKDLRTWAYDHCPDKGGLKECKEGIEDAEMRARQGMQQGYVTQHFNAWNGGGRP